MMKMHFWELSSFSRNVEVFEYGRLVSSLVKGRLCFEEVLVLESRIVLGVHLYHFIVVSCIEMWNCKLCKRFMYKT